MFIRNWRNLFIGIDCRYECCRLLAWFKEVKMECGYQYGFSMYPVFLLVPICYILPGKYTQLQRESRDKTDKSHWIFAITKRGAIFCRDMQGHRHLAIRYFIPIWATNFMFILYTGLQISERVSSQLSGQKSIYSKMPYSSWKFLSVLRNFLTDQAPKCLLTGISITCKKKQKYLAPGPFAIYALTVVLAILIWS